MDFFLGIFSAPCPLLPVQQGLDVPVDPKLVEEAVDLFGGDGTLLTEPDLASYTLSETLNAIPMGR